MLVIRLLPTLWDVAACARHSIIWRSRWPAQQESKRRLPGRDNRLAGAQDRRIDLVGVGVRLRDHAGSGPGWTTKASPGWASSAAIAHVFPVGRSVPGGGDGRIEPEQRWRARRWRCAAAKPSLVPRLLRSMARSRFWRLRTASAVIEVRAPWLAHIDGRAGAVHAGQGSFIGLVRQPPGHAAVPELPQDAPHIILVLPVAGVDADQLRSLRCRQLIVAGCCRLS